MRWNSSERSALARAMRAAVELQALLDVPDHRVLQLVAVLVEQRRRTAAGSRPRAASRRLRRRRRSRARRPRRCSRALEHFPLRFEHGGDARVHRQAAQVRAPGDARLLEVARERPGEHATRLGDARWASAGPGPAIAREQEAPRPRPCARSGPIDRQRVPGVRPRARRARGPGVGRKPTTLQKLPGLRRLAARSRAVGEGQHAARHGDGARRPRSRRRSS